jgi:hypothetical protein
VAISLLVVKETTMNATQETKVAVALNDLLTLDAIDALIESDPVIQARLNELVLTNVQATLTLGAITHTIPTAAKRITELVTLGKETGTNVMATLMAAAQAGVVAVIPSDLEKMFTEDNSKHTGYLPKTFAQEFRVLKQFLKDQGFNTGHTSNNHGIYELRDLDVAKSVESGTIVLTQKAKK